MIRGDSPRLNWVRVASLAFAEQSFASSLSSEMIRRSTSLAFCNGYELSPRADDAYKFLIGIASGNVSEVEVERWVARHLTEVRGEK
jgi:hypothetical protein